jgi:hypothetical protein
MIAVGSQFCSIQTNLERICSSKQGRSLRQISEVTIDEGLALPNHASKTDRKFRFAEQQIWERIIRHFRATDWKATQLEVLQWVVGGTADHPKVQVLWVRSRLGKHVAW